MANKDLAKKDDFRVIYKSDLIPNSPFAYLASLPPDLKAAIVEGLRRGADQGQGRLRQLSDGKDHGIHQGRRQVLRARRRADQVHRPAAQAEELTAAAGASVRLGFGPTEERTGGGWAKHRCCPPFETRSFGPLLRVRWCLPLVTDDLTDRPAAGGPVAALLDAYEASVRSRRWHTLLMVACIAVAMRAVVDLGRGLAAASFLDNIHRFPSYIIRLFQLENGQPGLDRFRRMVLGPAALAPAARRDLADGLRRHGAGRDRRFVLGFLAAANVAPSRWVRLTVRRFCELLPHRAGAGVRPGVRDRLRARPGWRACWPSPSTSLGALGKLFAEVVENIDMKPVEGVIAGGSSWPVAMRFGALPQVMSNFMSYALLRFEINVRSAAVMGFVGAGGIGQDLIEAIRKFYYSDVSAILVLILLTVSIIDTLTSHGATSPDRPAGEALMPGHFPVDLGAVRGRHPEHFQRFDRRRQAVARHGGRGLRPADLRHGRARLLRRQAAGRHGPAGRDCRPHAAARSDGLWAHARLFASALIETVAIALLGTAGRGCDPGAAARFAGGPQRHRPARGALLRRGVRSTPSAASTSWYGR